MKKIPAYSIALLFLLSSSVIAQTTISKSFVFGGVSRSYRVYIPDIYNDTLAVPLVFNLHGYGSNNQEQEVYGDFRPIADTANFIIVHPNGTVDGSGNRFWNTFGSSSTPNDAGFLSALIDTLKKTYNIDSKRIYSTGMSNGGFMSYDLACKLSNRITAIASVTGTMTKTRLTNCSPSRPVPVMQIHGTNDPTVPYNGSSTFSHIDSLVQKFVRHNNTDITPLYDSIPDTDTTDGCWAQHYVYANGDSGATVEFYKIIDGAHTWPGASYVVNTTNQDFKACIEIWRFFRKYTLDNFIVTGTKQEQETTVGTLKIYPNPVENEVFISNLPSPSTISVMDVHGKEITVNTRIENTTAGLSTTDWASGIYLIRITSENLAYTHKIIKY